MNRPTQNNYTLSIRSNISYLRNVYTFLNEVVDKKNLNKTIYKRLFLCVSEAVSNAIIHGNNNNSEKYVIINLDINKSEFKINIKDEGCGFNVENIPNPILVENIRNEKGRGLHIIKTFADEVRFLNNGSIIEFSIKSGADNTNFSGRYSCD